MKISEEARPGRVLVVDDNPDNRMLLRETLSGSGYAVVSAGSGEEALRTGSR